MKNIFAAAVILAMGIAGGIAGGGFIAEKRMADFIAANPQAIIASLEAGAEAERKAAILRVVESGEGEPPTIMGNPDGDVTIYEFSDYNCGYCKRSLGVLAEITASDKNIRIVVKEFPILSDGSVLAARYALAAALLGDYERFHTALMQRPGRIDEAAIMETIAALGMDAARLTAKLADPVIDETIERNRALADALGVTGTPGFIIGEEIIGGAIPAESMRAVIKQARAGNG